MANPNDEYLDCETIRKLQGLGHSTECDERLDYTPLTRRRVTLRLTYRGDGMAKPTGGKPIAPKRPKRKVMSASELVEITGTEWVELVQAHNEAHDVKEQHMAKLPDPVAIQERIRGAMEQQTLPIVAPLTTEELQREHLRIINTQIRQLEKHAKQHGITLSDVGDTKVSSSVAFHYYALLMVGAQLETELDGRFCPVCRGWIRGVDGRCPKQRGYAHRRWRAQRERSNSTNKYLRAITEY